MASIFGYPSARKAEGIAQFQNFSFLLASASAGTTFESKAVICIEGVEFGICIFPSGIPQEHSFRVELCASQATSSQVPIACKFKIDIMRGDVSVFTKEFSRPREFLKGEPWGWSKLEPRMPRSYPNHEDLSAAYKERLKAFDEEGWITDDVMTIRVSVEAVLGKPRLLRAMSAKRPSEGVLQLQSDLKRLLEDGAGSDVKLVSSDGSVPAHRLILAMRSPVFRAMFETNMAEARSGEILVRDVDSSSLGTFLRYLYCGALPEGIDDAKLWAVMCLGHKYEVLPLVEECAARLQAKLSAESAARMLIEADKLGIEALKTSALDFIVSTSCVFKQVQESEGYQALPAALLRDILSRSMGAGKRRRDPSGHEFPDGTRWEALKVEQLKRALDERGLSVSGNKAELVARLQQAGEAS